MLAPRMGVRMAAKSFGTRGLTPASARVVRYAPATPTPGPRVREAAPAAFAQDDAEASETARLFALFPLLTAGVIIFLSLVFAAQKHFAFDMRDNALSLGSIVALGGASRRLVFEGGEWWRIFLAPIYHGSLSHLVGNCVALGFLGARLEPLLGRWWMSAAFVISALGGMAGSMIGNAPDVTTVGASGAISGLIGALFAMSFHSRADEATQQAMRRTAWRFGIPALAPLLWGAHGTTDYSAHLGGAVSGAMVGAVVALLWDGRSFRPGLQRIAAAIAVGGLTMSGVSAAMAATQFKRHESRWAHLIPMSQTPRTVEEGAKRADEFVTRYPRDPRSHLFRAVALMQKDKLIAAEGELRAVIANSAEAGPSKVKLERTAEAYMAMIYAYQGRRADAQTMGKKVCGDRSMRSLQNSLKKYKICG